MKPLRETIWLKATEQFPVVLFIMLQKFEILTLESLDSFLKSHKFFSDEFCVREFKIVLIFLKSFFDTPYYKDYNAHFIISDGLCLAQFQSTVPAAPLHTKDLVKHPWLNLHNQASVYRLFWSNSHLLLQVWRHGVLGYEQLSYEWLNRLVSTKTKKKTNQNMGSVNVLSENEKLHIIGKVQGVVSILVKTVRIINASC